MHNTGKKFLVTTVNKQKESRHPMKIIKRLAPLIIVFALSPPGPPGRAQSPKDGGGAAAAQARSGRFAVLTYNVAGLPEPLSSSRPLFYTSKISPLLNAFDMVVAQEDFHYHADLKSKAEHPYISARSRQGVLGDGLSRFSVFPFAGVEHVAWERCYGSLGYANDCLTPKGFSMAAHQIAPGVKIDIYNLHMDAGGSKGDVDARDAQMDQLIAFMAERSPGRAVIIGGDWNLSGKRERDLEILDKIIAGEGLTDSCRALSCGKERIDRILFRGNDSITLKPVAYQVESKRFTTRHGLPLSDHKAVSVVFEWERAGE
jgi:hypothetical protein